MKRKAVRPRRCSLRLDPPTKAALEARAEGLWISASDLLRLIFKNAMDGARPAPEGLPPGSSSVAYTVALAAEEEAALRAWAGNPEGAEFTRILRAVLADALRRKRIHI